MTRQDLASRETPRPVRRGTSALAAWHRQRRVSPLWTVGVAVLLAIVLLPVGGVLGLALGPAGGIWAHLLSTVLPGAVLRTLLLMLGVGILTLSAGTGAAWLVTVFRFPLRDLVSWLLIVPLAIPTYIVAYCYVDLLDFTGPVQTGLRALLGVRHAGDYWFPSVKSLPGAIFVMSSVLYPYVYLSARASFVQQSAGPLEVARTLGHSFNGAFWKVALPLARPALVTGVSLALMECLNDVGAVEYLGVPTLTVTAYATWLQRSSLAGAAQIAAVMLVLVLAMLLIERASRGGRGFHDAGGRTRPPPELELTGWHGWVVLVACLVPVTAGFILPMTALLGSTRSAWHEALDPAFWHAAATSLGTAGVAAAATVLAGVLLAYARRVAPNGFTRPAVRLAGLGYAMPGTVLALGLISPLAGFDNWLNRVLQGLGAQPIGLLLSGSAFAVVLAYAIRFLAVSLGAIESGLARISPNLDAAARTLGQTAFGALRRVHLPLLRAPVGAAALLVFVDGMKELPATLLLRPFNFETLSTRVYGLAALDQFEDAALGALMIVLVGLIPLIWLDRVVTAGSWRGRRPR